MNRNFTFILALLFLAFTVSAQEIKSTKIFYLEEGFETGIPDSWTVETTGDISWEHRFDYVLTNSTGYPGKHVAGILTSPAVDVTSASSLSLVFKHYFYTMGSSTAVVEVFDGTNWVEVSYSSNYGEQVIDVTPYINDAFQVRFIYDDGNQWEMFWKLYNVLIYEQEIEDLAVTEIKPLSAIPGDTVIPQITVRNYGSMEINFFYDLHVTIAGTDYDVDLDHTYIGQLGTGFKVVDCPEWVVPMEEGDYEITATINYDGSDDDLSNNTMVLSCKVMNYPDATVGNNNGKFYKVNLENGDLTEYGGFESIPFSMADEFAEGRLYRMTEWMDFWEVAVDGSYTKITDANLYSQWTALGYAPFNYAMAYDWNTGRMYIAGDDGAGWPAGNPHLAYFDLETYTLVHVGQINTGAMIVGMDFADDGFLYGVGIDGHLYKINVDEFEVEDIGSTGMGGVIDKDFQDVSYDRANHILYGIFRYGSPWLSHFGSFNLETGEFTEIQNYDISNYACFAISKDPTFTLTFTVDNGTDPIEGAEIEINGETLTTNESGIATVYLLNGDYGYTVTSTGYDDYTGSVTIDNANEDVSVSMTATLYTLTFTVDNGTDPIEGAEININGETLTTNGSGVASIELENGDYDYTVTYPGYYDYTGSVTIDNADKDVSITMDQATGIDLISGKISISPNPSHGKYKISMNTNFTFEVYDINGIKVDYDNKWKSESIVDIRNKAKGIYFLKVNTKTETRVFKLINN